MSHAFEVTMNDLATVFSNEFNMHIDATSAQAERIFDRLNTVLIEQAALDADVGDETDDAAILNIQTTSAHTEIARQLRALSNR